METFSLIEKVILYGLDILDLILQEVGIQQEKLGE